MNGIDRVSVTTLLVLLAACGVLVVVIFGLGLADVATG
jgi:hypothetical protein